METSIARAIEARLQGLSENSAERESALQGLTDLCAASEATSALRSAAARARDAAGGAGRAAERPTAGAGERDLLADVLSTASAVWDAEVIAGDTAGAGRAIDAGRRAHLFRAVTAPSFLALVPAWVTELRATAATRPATGACTVATATQLWMWTVSHLPQATGAPLGGAAISELAEAFCWLLAARCQILAVVEGEQSAGATGGSGVPRAQEFFTDLCHVQAARTAGRVATLCTELVFGYRQHPAWGVEGCAACYQADDVDALEGLFPGFASAARAQTDVIEADGSHAAKAGPCARFDGLDGFTRLRTRLDGCLTGARRSKDRAAEALPRVLALGHSTH